MLISRIQIELLFPHDYIVLCMHDIETYEFLFLLHTKSSALLESFPHRQTFKSYLMNDLKIRHLINSSVIFNLISYSNNIKYLVDRPLFIFNSNSNSSVSQSFIYFFRTDSISHHLSSAHCEQERDRKRYHQVRDRDELEGANIYTSNAVAHRHMHLLNIFHSLILME